MTKATDKRPGLTHVVRWAARTGSVASIGLILAFIVGEGFQPARIRPHEWIGLLFFPVGICAGMILAWRREGLGGAITTGSLAAFYLVHFEAAGTFPAGWAYLVFAFPGFLFLFSACNRRPLKRSVSRQ
jgi:hypothetical protein